MKSTALVFLIFAGVLAAHAQRPQQPEWVGRVDANSDGRIDAAEYRAAADEFFRRTDRNSNGILERSELPGKPEGEQRRPMPPTEVPPFLFLEREDFSDMNREQFRQASAERFGRIDRNGDDAIDFAEIGSVRPPDRREGPRRPPFPDNPMARFIGAEMRFGDKVVKGAPFAAETVRTEQKRLFDGTLVTTENRGAIYRDGEGRVRTEQQFDRIGGFEVVGEDNRPKRLVHIIDNVAGKTYSVNSDTKTYIDVPVQRRPPIERETPADARTESLGKQTIDGVSAEGTRTTFEIPAGRIGNERPVLVVTERWFSPELQTVVMSKHTDPFVGEVVFRLVNIKLGEPATELFRVPADYKMAEPDRRDDRRPDMRDGDRRPRPGDRPMMRPGQRPGRP